MNQFRQYTSSFYLPLLFLYLELVFHLYMKMNLVYLPIYLLFGLSIGFLLNFFCNLLPPKINRIVTKTLGILAALIYCIEMECKMILQTYYQLLSSAKTAASNNLLDYKDAIVSGIVNHMFGLVFFLLPAILFAILGHRLVSFTRRKFPDVFVPLGLAVVLHIAALGSLYLPWNEDTEFLPKSLYITDNNTEDQVEKLGVFTMLRLDVKHALFGVSSGIEVNEDFSSVSQALNQTVATTSAPSKTPENKATPHATSSATTTPTATPSIDTSPNVLDIDLKELAKNADSDDLTWLYNYFDSVSPTNKNEYTGIFKGYNVIFLTAEGFSGYMIDKELTPTLYKLSHEGFVFNNFYTPLHFTSTSGGEFQNLVGLYPKGGFPISMTYTGENKTWLPFTLANQLNTLGYSSMGYHCNVNMYGRALSHPNLGYDWYQSGSGITMEKNDSGNSLWPQSDKYLFEQTIDQYMTKDTPFNVYYMTISGHLPYSFSGDNMAAKNKDRVKDLNYSGKTKAYIAANLELEDGLTYLLSTLKKAGKLDNTLICMCADHIPYSDVDILEELSGKSLGGKDLEMLNESDIDFDVYKNSLILWSGSMTDPVTVDKPCSQVDILPTLSNLLGLDYDSRLLAGSDILSDSAPLVHFSSNCWLTDKGFYNRFTGVFKKADGIDMSEDEQSKYVSAMKKLCNYKLKASELILTTDFYNTIPGIKRK